MPETIIYEGILRLSAHELPGQNLYQYQICKNYPGRGWLPIFTSEPIPKADVLSCGLARLHITLYAETGLFSTDFYQLIQPEIIARFSREK